MIYRMYDYYAFILQVLAYHTKICYVGFKYQSMDIDKTT